MDCSTIIVSYNTFELTREAVRTALDSAAELSHEVIIVDNHSSDQSDIRLRTAFPIESFPNVQIIVNDENVGFARANNQGAGLAKGRVLFFLNPDTVVHGQAIPILCDFLMAHPEAGAIGPHVQNLDGTDQRSTRSLWTASRILFYHFPIEALIHRLNPTRKNGSTVMAVDIVKGCALAIRRTTFDEVGGWDESYFLYSEETELCFSLLRNGYTNYYVPTATIMHLGGASSWEHYASQQVVHQRSVLQFLRRHHGPALVTLNRISGTIGYGIRASIFPLLAAIIPRQASEYRRRAQAAATLFRWFLREYV